MQFLRSLLFVPGSRGDRFVKALGAGADAVCIDLEDAVPPPDKAAARTTTVAFLAQDESGRAGVRTNPPRGAAGREDLAAIAALPRAPRLVMLPKAESAEDVAAARAALPRAALWPIVESAEGLKAAWEIAAAPGVEGVLFGAADYSADVGCTLEWDALLYARGRLAAACGRAGVQLLDVPHLDLNDPADLEASTRRSKALGFTGRACIHPAQVEAVHRVHTPAADEIERARRVVEALAAAAGGPALLDGKLIELPLARAARRVLDRAAL